MATGARHKRIATALAVCFCAAAVSAASAAPGDLHFLGCLSGDAGLASAGGNCLPAPGASAEGALSGFDQPTSLAVSPDGADVYAVSPTESAIVALHRDSATGALSFVNCITGDTAGVPCTQAPHAADEGRGSGMYHLAEAVVSPDGRHVYAAAPWDSAIVVFDRDPGSGALSWNSCLTGWEVAGEAGGGSCAEVPNSGLGWDTGLWEVGHLAISADGATVYGAGVHDAALTALDRDPVSGELSFVDCVTGKLSATSGEGGNCDQMVPGASTTGDRTALDDVFSVAVSPSGDYVYTVSEDEATIASFRRAASGAVSFASCVTGSSGSIGTSGGCATTPYTATLGLTSGLGRLVDVAVSPDGRDVYAASEVDAAIAAFEQDPESGALSFAGCITGDNRASTLIGHNCEPLATSSPEGQASGLDGLDSLTLSADGGRLYTAAVSDDAVGAFDRDPGDGSLALAGCVTANTATAPCSPIAGATAGGAGTGLDTPRSVAVSASGGQLYAASYEDDAVAWLEVEPAPAPPAQPPAGGTVPVATVPGDVVAPVLSALRIKPSKLVAAGGRAAARSSAARRSGKRGATVSFRLSEDARVVVSVERALPGLRKRAHGKSRCVKPTRALRRTGAKRCRRFRAMRPTLARDGRRGANAFRFHGRLGRRVLAPGRYRLVLRATDAAGNESDPLARPFRVVRPRRTR
jgi:6-phosphogluconolactonase (cycloisomerase 2 family)